MGNQLFWNGLSKKDGTFALTNKKKTSKKFFLHSMLVSYSNWKLLLMVTPLTGCLNAPYVEGKCSCKTTKLSFQFVFIHLHSYLKFFQWPTLITHFTQCISTSCEESFTVDQNRNARQKCQLIRPVIKTFFQNVVNWLHFSLHFIEALSIDGVSVSNGKQYSFLLFYSSKPRNQV